MFVGKTFDDFLLRPYQSIVSSRRDIHLRMSLSQTFGIANPIIGANMDTVTDQRMAQALALEGCFGFIHRNCSIDAEAAQVAFVKRQHSFVIEHPEILPASATLGEAKKRMAQTGVSGILIEKVQGSRILDGILSHRDIPQGKDQDDTSVCQFMTNVEDGIKVGVPGISLEEAEQMMYRARVEKLPLIQDGKIFGLITMRDLQLTKKKPHSSKDKRGRLLVGAAIGATGDFMERAEALDAADADCLLMDVAHAHAEVVARAMKRFREKFPNVVLMCGNVATAEGAKFLQELGVDAIKVGIGPGRGCRTRLETAAGVPQLQAIREAYLATEYKIPIIADGGIKNDKDIFLAIACGASAVMLGSMLSGTDEAPGRIVEDPQTKQKMKLYRGMTAPTAVADGVDDEHLSDALQTPSEGQSTMVPYKGSVVDIIKRIRGHLQSSVSYAGFANLATAQSAISADPAEYLISLSEAARKESFER